MASVIELSGRGPEALSGAGGGFEPEALAGDPLASYLGHEETVAYALVLKRRSVTVERADGTETLDPARGYRAVAVVTDRRVLVAVGGGTASEDRVESIRMASITGVEADTGLWRGALVVETDDGERWSIPCRGNLDPVVAYVRTVRRAWRAAGEYAADVDTYLDSAREHLDDGDLDTALSAVREAGGLLDRAEDRLAEFDVGPGVLQGSGLARRRRQVRRLRRRAYAQVGDRARERARQRQADDDYEGAHTAVESAREAYRRAADVDAPDPSDEALDDRLVTLDWQAEDLARAPLAEATTAGAAVEERATLLGRAAALSRALERYRDLLGLCWGPSAAFAGDSDEVRDRIEGIVADLIRTRVHLARRALTAADRFTARGDDDPALAACDVASAHLDAVREVALELAPDRVGVIDAWDDGVDEQRERIRNPDWADLPGTSPADDAAEGGTAPEGARADTEAGSTAGIALADPGEESAATGGTADWSGGADNDDGGVAGEDSDGQSVATRLRELDDSRFTGFVAMLWRELGWETTAFTAAVDQYDVMATRRGPVELRVLIWAVHDPGGDLDTAAVDRCAADRAQVDGADAVALVTTADVPPAVRDRAESHNVKLLDFEDLVALVERRDLADILD